MSDEKPTVHSPPNRIARIETIWAFLSVDETGEGIAGAMMRGQWWQLVTADEKLASTMKPVAQQVATLTGKKIKLVKFTAREEIEEILPENSGRG